MDFLEDFLAELSAEPEAPTVSKFQPKAKGRSKKVSSTATKSNAVDTTAEQNNFVGKESEVHRSSPLTNTDHADQPDETPAPVTLSTENEVASLFPDVSFASPSPFRPCTARGAHDVSVPSEFDDSGDFQIDVEQLEAGDFSCLDAVGVMDEGTTVPATAPGKKAVKFQPKPKAHVRTKDPVKATPSMGESGAVIFQDTDGGNENEYVFADGINDGIHGNNSSPEKATEEAISNKDENEVSEHLGDGTPQKKRGRRSKKDASVNDKPTRKRKNASKKPDQSIDKPPKKFPHATRRKRCVDKSLVDAQDELDLQRVPIKDLILLAEHNERQAKKGGAAVQPLTSNERTNDFQSEDLPYDDDGAFGFEQDRDPVDAPSTSGVQTYTGYFNYQSFMKKERRAKWTKKDTELFYQGIRQFGTDFSMIEQLFHDRTRDQIKLKYKKEQRENPMLLEDALTSRTTDLSHFKTVIERLKQEQAAREAEDERNRGSDEEDAVEDTFETNATSQENAVKPEETAPDKDAGDDDLFSLFAGSPAKSDYNEDDFMDYQGFD